MAKKPNDLICPFTDLSENIIRKRNVYTFIHANLLKADCNIIIIWCVTKQVISLQ